MQPSERLTVEGSLEVCPECGYEGGFHVLIQRRDDVPDANIRLHLKCPGCGATYDLGWVGRLVE